MNDEEIRQNFRNAKQYMHDVCEKFLHCDDCRVKDICGWLRMDAPPESWEDMEEKHDGSWKASDDHA